MQPKTSVETRQDLLHLLTQVSELEHSLACQYLFAAFSLKQKGEPGVSDEQAEVINHWRLTLIEIAVQEMLHLSLASNLLTAIGGAPFFDRANFPQPKTYSCLGLDFRLARASEDTLRRFASFELPPALSDDSVYRNWPIQGREPIDWVEHCARPNSEQTDDITQGHVPLLPSHFAYSSIGEAYDLIRDGFVKLYPGDEGALFIGPPQVQNEGMWQRLTAVTDRASAKRAIDTILFQGEGAYGNDADIAVAHFGRFAKIYTEMVEGLGGGHPAHDVVDNPIFTLHSDLFVEVTLADSTVEKVRPALLTSQVARDANEIFISIYELSLLVLERYFAGEGETEEQRYILKQVFLSLMRFCITPLGTAIARLPAFRDSADGPRAGASFEVYSGVSLLPHLRSAWRVFEEHLEDMAKACDALAADGVSEPYPMLRKALVGAPATATASGVANVLRQYALLMRVGLDPPEKWTWRNGIRAFFSPLDVLRMGPWIASEAAVREKFETILARITSDSGMRMPPDSLLGDTNVPADRQNPEGRWTEARILAFTQWAATVRDG